MLTFVNVSFESVWQFNSFRNEFNTKCKCNSLRLFFHYFHDNSWKANSYCLRLPSHERRDYFHLCHQNQSCCITGMGSVSQRDISFLARKWLQIRHRFSKICASHFMLTSRGYKCCLMCHCYSVPCMHSLAGQSGK